MIETWAVILTGVIFCIGVLICAKNKWKKYQLKYFTEEPEENVLDIEALEFTIDEPVEPVRRNSHREMENDNYDAVPRPTLQRTNSL